MPAPSGDRALPKLSDFWFGIHATHFCIVTVVLAPSGDRAVPASQYYACFAMTDIGLPVSIYL